MCGECYKGADNLEALLDAVNYNRFLVNGFVRTQGNSGRLHCCGDHRLSGGQPIRYFEGLKNNPTNCNEWVARILPLITCLAPA